MVRRRWTRPCRKPSLANASGRKTSAGLAVLARCGGVFGSCFAVVVDFVFFCGFGGFCDFDGFGGLGRFWPFWRFLCAFGGCGFGGVSTPDPLGQVKVSHPFAGVLFRGKYRKGLVGFSFPNI